MLNKQVSALVAVPSVSVSYINYVLLYFVIYSLNLYVIVFSLQSLQITPFSHITSFFYLNPTLRIYFFLSSLCLLGIPPVSGFVIKFNLMVFVLLKGSLVGFLILIGYLVISIFFYLRLIGLSVVKKPNNTTFRQLKKSRRGAGYNYYLFASFIVFFNLFLIFFYKDLYLVCSCV